MIKIGEPDDQGIVTVTFGWSNKHGTCIDCGCPAAYEVVDLYGDRTSPEDDTRKCCVCAASDAAGGHTIRYLFAEGAS